MTFSLFFFWLSLVWATGWLAFPLVRRLLPDFPDAGLAVSRVVFLCFWTLAAFWLGYAGVAPAVSAWLYLVLGGVGLWFWRRDFPAIRREIRDRKRAILTVEAVFLGVFLLFFLLRGFWSDTNGSNGEKGMDSALIAALSRTDSLPTSTPYAAGSRLQGYYFFGHLETALLTVASGTTTRWSYNLMCATLPALCVSMLFSVGATLTRRLWGGAFVAFAVLFLGTLQPIFQWLHQDQWSQTRFLRLDFFAVSRVLPNAINEFPFFTFNQADLHAHYFNFQFQLAAITLALAFFLRPKWPILLALCAVLGAQLLTNTWDFAAYFLLCVLVIWNVRQSHAEVFQDAISIANRFRFPEKLAATAFVLLNAAFLAAPFLLNLSSAASGPKPLLQPASPLREWVLMWGFSLFAWWNFLTWRAFASRRFRMGSLALGVLVLAAWFWSSWGYPVGVRAPYSPEALAAWQSLLNPARLVLPLILISLGVSIWAILRGKISDSRARFLPFLAVAGLFALLVSETTWAGFLGSADTPGFDDFKRQDTVFKFGLQTWMLLGTAAAAGAFLSFRSWPKPFQIAVWPLILVMATSSVAVVHGRTHGFSQFERWDAWAHLKTSEKSAAQWLEKYVSTGQYILEAEQEEGGDFSAFTRYAHATGIATIIGPRAHTFVWAPANSREISREWDEVNRRKDHARAIFQGVPNRHELLRDYGVKFVVFGELERAEYGENALKSLRNDAKMERLAVFGAEDDAHRVEIFWVK